MAWPSMIRGDRRLCFHSDSVIFPRLRSIRAFLPPNTTLPSGRRRCSDFAREIPESTSQVFIPCPTVGPESQIQFLLGHAVTQPAIGGPDHSGLPAPQLSQNREKIGTGAIGQFDRAMHEGWRAHDAAIPTVILETRSYSFPPRVQTPQLVGRCSSRAIDSQCAFI